MTALLFELWQLCLFRGTPARLPGVWLLSLLLIVASVLVSMLVASVLTAQSDREGLFQGLLVYNAVIIALIALSLHIRGLRARLPQTLTALFGCDLVLTALFGALLAGANALTGPSMLVDLLQMLNLLWTILLTGYIVHKALEMPLLFGTLVALGILMAGLSIGQIILEGPSA